jgi:hypothetical protein
MAADFLGDHHSPSTKASHDSFIILASAPVMVRMALSSIASESRIETKRVCSVIEESVDMWKRRLAHLNAQAIIRANAQNTSEEGLSYDAIKSMQYYLQRRRERIRVLQEEAIKNSIHACTLAL